ncbi:hypothetical protein CXF83_21765 [Shewanella sp. Choline-02u-19]|nr:hypothetical protein CXF84_02570 [Shewanella sp. Bg11-22]PKI29147.1 hypothetical protein CXF83_21765 [Shewanella sp. Choline-02u-19]
MAEAFDGMDAIVELPRPIMFQTEFGISSIHGGQMDLQRASGMSAHALATGHWNHKCQCLLQYLFDNPA